MGKYLPDDFDKFAGIMSKYVAEKLGLTGNKIETTGKCTCPIVPKNIKKSD